MQICEVMNTPAFSVLIYFQLTGEAKISKLAKELGRHPQVLEETKTERGGRTVSVTHCNNRAEMCFQLVLLCL